MNEFSQYFFLLDTDNRNLGGANSQSGDSSGSTTQNPSIVIEDPVIIIYGKLALILLTLFYMKH